MSVCSLIFIEVYNNNMNNFPNFFLIKFPFTFAGDSPTDFSTDPSTPMNASTRSVRGRLGRLRDTVAAQALR